jgi:hypothetical protein
MGKGVTPHLWALLWSVVGTAIFTWLTTWYQSVLKAEEAAKVHLDPLSSVVAGMPPLLVLLLILAIAVVFFIVISKSMAARKPNQDADDIEVVRMQRDASREQLDACTQQRDAARIQRDTAQLQRDDCLKEVQLLKTQVAALVKTVDTSERGLKRASESALAKKVTELEASVANWKQQADTAKTALARHRYSTGIIRPDEMSPTPLTDLGADARAARMFPHMSRKLVDEIVAGKSDNEIWNEIGEAERDKYAD